MKEKKAQLFGMPFSMIFSILLMVFFIVAAGIAIKFFINISEKASTGLFIEELRNTIDEARNANSYSSNAKTFESSLPFGITHICFINMSGILSAGTDDIERKVFREGKFGSYSNNLIFWPLEKAEELSHIKISGIKLPETNPKCFKVEDGKVDMKIERTFEEDLVRVEDDID